MKNPATPVARRAGQAIGIKPTNVIDRPISAIPPERAQLTIRRRPRRSECPTIDWYAQLGLDLAVAPADAEIGGAP